MDQFICVASNNNQIITRTKKIEYTKKTVNAKKIVYTALTTTTGTDFLNIR